MTLQCTYLNHQTRINAVCFSPRHDLLLSICREKKLNFYSTNPVDDNTRSPLGTYGLNSWGMSIAINETTRECFVGDASGTIHFLELTTDNKCRLKTTLNGHSGKILNRRFKKKTKRNAFFLKSNDFTSFIE